MPPAPLPRTDVLLAVLGAPHGSDMVTSMFRLLQAMLERGARVQVWACGYATMLTQRSLGEFKPRDLTAWDVDYPSTPALVRELLAAFPDQLYWYGCRFCSDERGADRHLPEVRLRAPAKFAENVEAAGKTIFVGVT